MQAQRGKSGASFPLQLVLSTLIYYAPCWVIITLSLLIYKGTRLPFPPSAYGGEIAGVIMLYVLQVAACTLGKRGNLTENVGVLGVSVALLIPLVAGSVYYMWLQTYVMRLDLGVSASLLGLNSLAMLFAFQALSTASGANAAGAVQRMMLPQTVPSSAAHHGSGTSQSGSSAPSQRPPSQHN